MATMTTAIPTWTLADRLVKARHHAGMNQAELAALLGVSRRTITRYEDAGIEPKRAIVLAWAMATGVDSQWLEHGTFDIDWYPRGFDPSNTPVRHLTRAA